MTSSTLTLQVLLSKCPHDLRLWGQGSPTWIWGSGRKRQPWHYRHTKPHPRLEVSNGCIRWVKELKLRPRGRETAPMFCVPSPPSCRSSHLFSSFLTVEVRLPSDLLLVLGADIVMDILHVVN